MKIEYYSDFNCPYSYIGLKRLTDAVNELNLTPKWELKSFELPLSNKINFKEVEENTKNDNLTIKPISLTSSRNAHRLTKFVQKNYPELSQELIFKIYKANFEKNKTISDIGVLSEITASIGLNPDEISKMLLSKSYDLEVELEMQDAVFNGITAIPHYSIYIDGQRLIIPGAFEKEDFKIALEDLASGNIKEKTFI
ncbi:DsbA family protein [Methanobrevibacter sp.]|uniref:DsbA family oxidoreductase n=1 Tax=Methanobrevibacter sp. TaxID=66852 RepID=UPI0025D86004|nr:DsbA family protein [Methanobrevibacter sp.]MBQ2831371.1 DsbA family protein [Methanobrevibacter sp.]